MTNSTNSLGSGSDAPKATDKSAAADKPPLKIDDIIGSYRIVSAITKGGMGWIYEAQHQSSGQIVAIKVLSEQYSKRQGHLKRFFSDALAATQVVHGNILKIIDFSKDSERDAHYLVMERLRGFDLDELLEAEGPLPPKRCVDIASQVASALYAAHQAGIVHCDLKPDNVFLAEGYGREDFVKVLDFGIARLLEPQEPSVERDGEDTNPMTSMTGTPAYMSPEQACGGDVDHHSDIYSLGVILYEMLTGRVPFEVYSFGELLVKHTVMKPKRPSKVEGCIRAIPEALDDLVMCCLEIQPADRPSTMEEIQRLLGKVITID